MQKLTYINLLNQQVVFMHAPYVLAKVSGLGMPELDVETLRGAYQQGDTTLGLRRAARTVTLSVHLMAGTRAELYALRQQLLGVLSPDRACDGDGRATLIYENDHGRYMTYAVPVGGLDAASRIGNVQPSLRLSFRCESPYWYDMTQSELCFGYSGEGFSLPLVFPISFGRRDHAQTAHNPGQVAAPVELTVEGRGETPSVLNRRTGKRLKLRTPLPSGSTLTLNTDPARLAATVMNAQGESSSAFGLLDIATPLADFTLLPGSNELVYESGGAGAQSVIRVKWRAAYEGV